MMTISHNIVTLARKKKWFHTNFFKIKYMHMWVTCSTPYQETSHEINNSYAHIIKIKIFGEHIYIWVYNQFHLKHKTYVGMN
jgi:hypothetical protein